MHKHHDPTNPALHRDQNRAAWRTLLKEVREVLSIVLTVAAVGYLIFLGAQWIYTNNYADLAIRIIVSALCSVALGLFLWFRKENIRMEMLGNPGAWLRNHGQPPEGVERVSVERESGQKEWNVAVTDIKWSLAEEDPIKTYYPKKKVAR